MSKLRKRRHPGLHDPLTFALALTALLVAVLAAVAGPALARGHMPTVAVPRVTGDVNRAYILLRHDGFRVSIAHPFTLRSDALTAVTSVSPKAGRRVRRGSAVTLTVRCCLRLAHPPHVFGRGSPNLPRMMGRTLGEATALVRSDQKRYRATAGSLRAATAPALAGNYVVTRQSVPAGGDLPGTSVLAFVAHQGRPAPCTAPYFAQTLVRDRQAIVYAGPDEGHLPTVSYYGCVRRQNIERVLVRSNIYNAINTDISQPAVAGTRFVAAIFNGNGKGQGGPYANTVVGWDLATGKRTTLSDAGESSIHQLSLNDHGFAAWRTVTMPSTSVALTGVSCPDPSFCAATDTSGSVLTSGAPTGGRGAWAHTQLPTTELSAIACPSAGLCVVAIGGELLASASPAGGARTWQQIMLPTGYTGVSCPSASLCVAVGGNTVATSTNPVVASSWTVDHVSATGLEFVTCPSMSLCVASTNNGGVVTSTDPQAGASTWSEIQVGDRLLTGIACGSPTLCVTGDGSGHIFTTTGPAGPAPAWSLTAAGYWSPGPFSCASNHLCVAGIGEGVIVSTDPTGSASAWSTVTIPGIRYITGVSCVPGGGLCAAVDPDGNIATSTDPAGGVSTWSVAPIDLLPCADAGGCDTESIMASDESGVRTLDSTATGNGAQLQNLNLHGDALTWTHDGAARSEPLR